MPTLTATEWQEKVKGLRTIPNVVWVGQVAPFTAPEAGHFYSIREFKFLITKSGQVDGVVLGTTPNRANCLVGIEMPTDSAIIIIAASPTVLETLVPSVFKLMKQSSAICTPERERNK